MTRNLLVVAVLALSGCASYGSTQYQDHVVYRDGSYYSPSESGYGDYYYAPEYTDYHYYDNYGYGFGYGYGGGPWGYGGWCFQYRPCLGGYGGYGGHAGYWNSGWGFQLSYGGPWYGSYYGGHHWRGHDRDWDHGWDRDRDHRGRDRDHDHDDDRDRDDRGDRDNDDRDPGRGNPDRPPVIEEPGTGGPPSRDDGRTRRPVPGRPRDNYRDETRIPTPRENREAEGRTPNDVRVTDGAFVPTPVLRQKPNQPSPRVNDGRYRGEPGVRYPTQREVRGDGPVRGEPVVRYPTPRVVRGDGSYGGNADVRVPAPRVVATAPAPAPEPSREAPAEAPRDRSDDRPPQRMERPRSSTRQDGSSRGERRTRPALQ